MEVVVGYHVRWYSGYLTFWTIPAKELALVHRFVEKYDISGVAGFVHFLTSSLDERSKRLQELEHLNHDVNRMNIQIERLKYRSGSVVNYEDRPRIGTRVVGNSGAYSKKSGTIIANDEDRGTEIGVRWDDGTESHNLWCCKKGGQALVYK